MKTLKSSFIFFIFIMLISLFCFESNSIAEVLQEDKNQIVDEIRKIDIFVSENKITGKSQKLNLSFSTISMDNILTVALHFNEKEIIIKKGFNEKEKELYIKGYFTANNNIVTFSEEDYEILEILLLEINIDNNGKLENMFLNTLNLLHSWPEHFPIFVLMDQLKVVALTRDREPMTFNRSDFDSRKINKDLFSSENFEEEIDNNLLGGIEPKSFQSPNLCDYYGQEMPGFYLKLIFFIFYWSDFRWTVGGEDCFGRCGKGCIGDGLPNNTFNRYTQSCFNHDGCVEFTFLGYIADSCNIMFLWAIHDFFTAEDCPEAY